MNARNFLAELKRRNVYKVAVAYAVVGWLVIQGRSTVLPTFHAPEWVVQTLVVLVAIGFPTALVIAWAFELTPEGLKRAEDVDLAMKRRPKSHAWIYVVAVGAVLSIGLFMLGRYGFREKNSSTVELPAKSIAVLPFDNLSEDKSNAYFAEGVQDEILTRLATVADMKVISRTSTQHCKSAPDNLPQIAKQLGVAHILEGSVQKSNDQVRVNVQLINALTDAHLWGDTYDRKLTDIFAVESEIAKTIADTLQAKLTGSEQHAIAARPTENTEAHQLYLKGRFFWNKRHGNDLEKSIDYFNQAIPADPKYALAYAGVAEAYVLLPTYAGGTPQECYPKAEAAAERALALDGTVAEAHNALGEAFLYYDFDFSRSIREFQRAIELKPNYASAHQWYGNDLLVPLGRFDEAIAEVKRALELDPLSLIINEDLGNTYYSARRYDEAIEQLTKTLELDSSFYYAHWSLGVAFEAKGTLDAAIEEDQKARALNDDPFVLALLGHAYASSGNEAEALKILDQLKELSKQRYVTAYNFAIVYLGLGDKEEALRWLQKSYQDRAGYDIATIKVDPFLDPLRGDPRFEELVAKVLAPKNGSSP